MAEWIAIGVVAVISVWVTVVGVISTRRSTHALVIERRRRFVEKSESEVLDTEPEQWVIEAEEDFDLNQQYLTGQVTTQRRRDLRLIEKQWRPREKGGPEGPPSPTT